MREKASRNRSAVPVRPRESPLPLAARLSRATVARLSWYLRQVQMSERTGATRISSRELADALGVTAAQVRKDLAAIGSLGHPGIGYRPQELAEAIRQVLGLDRTWSVVLVGVGNLARALLRYAGFGRQGFHFVAVFDSDPAKIGQTVEGLTIWPMSELTPRIAALGAQLAILTVPAHAAQGVADQLVAAGIRGILNFAPVVLRVPSTVSLVSVDLTVQLEQLAYLVLNATANGESSRHS
ncbi:MAG: redox-sensing transcriptional repressor Rex [Gemmatales bacterium]|nr:redox-sensing transcriptional repressor Rex [Gemmatales bacterium]MCS7158989.1 redox-sensing transcriptional repressor Rex [Gemmatales bacterium]MDW8174189.1 redox-sensing transcriptional repressor Rex [Gemmatales bacterium]MDW8221848.1 redox-sensing transcriptional repressor Rex [Gemmatales bacterium]